MKNKKNQESVGNFIRTADPFISDIIKDSIIESSNKKFGIYCVEILLNE